jgi:hypothetical protein
MILIMTKTLTKRIISENKSSITHNGWVYEKVFYLELSKFIHTFVKNFLIHLVIQRFLLLTLKINIMNEELIKLRNAEILPTKGFILDGKIPTQSLVQKWLRETHGINIFMSFKPNIKKWDFIPYFMSMNAKEYIKHNREYLKIHNERRYDTYEEALEDGIYESLEMIP